MTHVARFTVPFGLVRSEDSVLRLPEDVDEVRLRLLAQAGAMILWDYEGMYGLVSKAQVKDLSLQLDRAATIAKEYPRAAPMPVTLHFSAVRPISTALVRLLIESG